MIGAAAGGLIFGCESGNAATKMAGRLTQKYYRWFAKSRLKQSSVINKV
jgi:hypothetical protein